MAANQDRGALEDLEAMLDRSLKIKASPPRWQPTYRINAGQPVQPVDQGPVTPSRHPSGSVSSNNGSVHHGPTHSGSAHYDVATNHGVAPGRVSGSPSNSVTPNGHGSPHYNHPRPFSPTRMYPQRVPVPNSYPSTSPQAVYHPPPTARVETQAIPNPNAALGMRPSSSQHSIASASSPVDSWEHRQQQAAAEAQRQQQIVRQQQAEQQRLELQRHERLMLLQEQQEQQERELEMLRRKDAQYRSTLLAAQQQDAMENEAHYRSNSRQDSMRQEAMRQEAMRQESIRQESMRQEAMRQEAMRQEAMRQENIRQESLRQENIRIEAKRRDAEEIARQEDLLKHQQREQEEREQEELANQKQRDALEREEEASRAEAARQRQLQLEAERARESRLEREGAATMVQRMQDSQGNITTRVVKKGVEDFEFKEELGAGSYSTVVAAQDKQTLRQYAIKVLDKAHIIKEQKVKYVEIEKHTLNRLGDHPGIIRLYFTFQDRQSLYFVLDFAPNGELLHLIKRIGSLNEDCARYYSCQLLDSIEYMHAKGIIHRDLKPENILLDYKMRIKITDFGTAKLLDADPNTGNYPSDARANSFVGTAEYVSPELLVGKSQGKSADIWAWGCVLYQMIAASPPFQGNTQYLTFQKIARLQYSIPPGFPYVVRDLLRHVLVKPQQRWTLDEIKQHEFFENQDWSQKAIWSSPPPRLQPYKASVASMKPRALGGKQPPRAKHAPVVRPNPSASASGAGAKKAVTQPQQQQQVFVPTSAGLQSLNPSTLYGMPVSINRSTEQVHPKSAASNAALRSAKKPSQSANAATSALYKTSPAHTSAYQQSQEKISALKKRMQEQRQAGRQVSSSSRPTSQGSRSSTPSSPAISSPPTDSRSPTIDTQSSARISSPSPPASPQLPLLPQPPLTQLESQYSTILVSAQERILRIGRMSLLVSTHLPPQAQVPASSPSSSSRHNGNKEGADSKKGKDEQVDVAFSYEDDSLFSKLFLSKNKSRLVIVTTCGRLVIMADDRKILYEVPLGVPQIEVSEIPFLVGEGRTTKIVVQTYNKVLTLDDPGHNSEWMASIGLSKRYYAQLTADQERNAFNAAAAAASAVAGRRR